MRSRGRRTFQVALYISIWLDFPHYDKIQDLIRNPSRNDLRIDTSALSDRIVTILIQKLEIGGQNLENGERKSEKWTSEALNLGGPGGCRVPVWGGGLGPIY